MMPQRRLQSSKQGHALFAQARQVTTNATKSDGSLITAKSARNFLLDFDHANIALDKVVVNVNA